MDSKSTPDRGTREQQHEDIGADLKSGSEASKAFRDTHANHSDSHQFTDATGVDAESNDSEMDPVGDAYRRRKANSNSNTGNESTSSPSQTAEPITDHMAASHAKSTNGRLDNLDSDYSSMSASEDVELDRLGSVDGSSDDDEETGLTRRDRKDRERRRRRNTDLDSRIGGNDSNQQEKKGADRAVLISLLLNGLLIGSWYVFSLSISIVRGIVTQAPDDRRELTLNQYNKWMFSPDHLNFHFPLFTTCLHMLVQLCLAALVLFFIPRLRPQPEPLPVQSEVVQEQPGSSKKPVMTRWFYLTRCFPCGAATGLDIGLGNMSMRFITLTFYTMCKSSSLAFVLCFAFLFRLEKPSLKLIMIISTMTIGVIMMVAGETEFQLLGFILVMLAAFFSGFRWSLTQILLLRSSATSNPFSSIFFLAPVMFLSLAVIAVPVEGFGELAKGLGILTDSRGVLMAICILLFPGFLAFMMTASEFALLQRTSVVTLSICGIFKEVVTITAAAIVFHDPLTPINISGLLVTIASIAAYNYLKITKMRQDRRSEMESSSKGQDEVVESEAEEASSVVGGKPSEGHYNDFETDHERPTKVSQASAKSQRDYEL